MAKAKVLSLILLATIVCFFQASVLRASTWVIGDVFAGLSGGLYNVYSNSGVFKETIGLAGSYGTGCAFNPAKTQLYTTNFSNNVRVFDLVHPHGLLQTIPSSGVESVVFASNGEFYTGNTTNPIRKFSSAGTLLQTYSNIGRSDFVDLAADQQTLFYTEEGTNVRRLNASGVGTQLTSFSTAGSNFFALRLLPPGDGSTGLMVANNGNVLRLNSSGAIVQTYAPGGAGQLFFALNLDPNGTSFWTAGLSSGNIYRLNIATGAIEVGPIITGTSVGGLCLLGEPTAGGGFGAAPPSSGCPAHAHGHVSTGAPGHFAALGNPHEHHAQHGTHLPPNSCPPHQPGHNALTGDPQEEVLDAAAPSAGLDFIVALNQDGVLQPAARGSVVQLFGPARGLFLDNQDQQSALGFTPPASGSPLYSTTSLPEVRIGGRLAKVLFSGLAPGVAGLWQINVLIPEDAGTGKTPVAITYEGQAVRSVDIEVR